VSRRASGNHEVAARPGPLDKSRVRPAQQPAGIVRKGRGRSERRPHQRRASPCLQAVPDDIADDRQG
jgi:hypothetical protein